MVREYASLTPIKFIETFFVAQTVVYLCEVPRALEKHVYSAVVG